MSSLPKIHALSPPLRELIQETLREDPRVEAFSNKYGRCTYSLSGRVLTLRASCGVEEELLLSDDSLRERMDRVREIFVEGQEVMAVAKQLAASQNYTAKAFSAADVAAGLMAFIRYGIIAKSGEQHPFAMKLAPVIGAVWVVGAIYDVKRRIGELKRAEAVGDKESMVRVKEFLAMGIANLGGSFTFLADKVADFANTAAGSGAHEILGPMSGGFFGVTSGIGVLIALHGISRCKQFRRELDACYDQDETVRLRKELEFLVSKITVDKGENRAQSGEAKARAFKRRTSKAALGLVSESAAGLLNEFNRGNPSDLLKAKAKRLIEFIRSENEKKTKVFYVYFFIAMLGLAAFLIGTFLSAGLLPLALFSAGLVVSLTMVAYQEFSGWLEAMDVRDVLNVPEEHFQSLENRGIA